jgi:hypothetical protein
MAYIGKTPSQAVRSRYFYTATGGETSLSGADDNGDTLIFADGNYVDVYLNGVLLVASSDYNVNTVNTIAGLTALTASDIVEIVVYDTFSVFGGTFQGTLTANQFVGPLTGNVTGELNGAINFIVKNLSGGTITKGTPVYISGHSGNTPEVNVADADDPAKMPAIGVATEDFNNNTQGNIVTFGDLIGFNTAAFNVNDELYVSATGTLTATRPNASNTEVQKIAKVVRSHSTNGQLFIMGAGRSNDVPNAITTNSINLSSTTTVDSVLDEDTMTSDSATALATQQSIKAYVDSQIGSNNELSEILTNGNTTGSNDILFGDNDKAVFGAGSDLQIYHDGGNSYIRDTGTGNLKIWSGAGLDIQTTTGENYIDAVENGTVRLYYDNSKKLETTATGVDVTGYIDYGPSSGNIGKIGFDSNNVYIGSTSSTGSIHFRNNIGSTDAPHSSGDDKMVITDSGVGIGTTSGNGNLTVASTGDAELDILADSDNNGSNQWPILNFRINSPTGTPAARIYKKENDDALVFDNAGTERMRITSSGNVGIGTSSPTSGKLVLNSTQTGTEKQLVIRDSTNGWTRKIGVDTSNNLGFFDGDTERMRIDSSGNLLVGTTSSPATLISTSSTEGFAYGNGLYQVTSRTDGVTSYFNRLNSNGSIVEFRKNGSTVGSIGVADGDNLFISSTASAHGGLKFNNTAMAAYVDGANSDNTMDVGTSAVRFKDLYLSGSISDGTNSKTVADIVSGGGGGGLIQTVSTHHVTSTTISGTAFTQYSGLNTSITPTSSSNKVLVTVHINMSAVGDSFPAFRIYRGGTWIGQSNTVSPGIETTFAHAVPTGGASVTVQMGVASFTFLDSPSTTSATTYSVYISPMRTTSRTLRINESYSRGDDNQYSGSSTMILMEVT